MAAVFLEAIPLCLLGSAVKDALKSPGHRIGAGESGLFAQEGILSDFDLVGVGR